ncbi:putative RNA polymerase II subunit B1 CTD phosphatase RPAP2 homolog [Drosophila miranda]|uniref:putative RNA polymerase II subunit B1 CTD phosphatase RPAP2 homolog n=1 Tax=Drosophila miranda TaxID=7229 RepID=UPI0007E880A0|nr:putative RNA polymerase II subunit B1 CTD phosphatase RPAP2 homolog [Drosophila miranda]XP_033248517.1 putative RNA polymerase II subunit B1 CTD phosphatase RPAP2 homolog [Drosophila miranda]XP_033248518.1 putative RNA polymerase II subunit B1 CTD phosphatase RPAP2 homolog [Drosophila miranda]
MTEEKNDQLRQQLIAAVVKKRAAIARAQEVVVRLLEPDVAELEFLAMLWEIAPNHYTDIVDEREISRYCGYPLCSNVLQNVPNQKYQISASQNKVYDITERKKFCSGYCFRASEYIKAQVPTSPLWLRDRELRPSFQLLPRDK